MIVFKCRRVMILPMLIFVWECHSKTPAKGMAARAHALTLGLLQSDSRAGWRRKPETVGALGS